MPEKGFFSSLFDISFQSFVTPRVVGVLYILGLIVTGLYALFIVIAAFAADTALGVAALVIGAPLAFLLGALYVRMLLELAIVLFRINDNTRAAAAALGGGGSEPAFPPSGPATQPLPPTGPESPQPPGA